MAQNNPASTTLTLESLPFDIHVELLVTLLSAERSTMGYSHIVHLIPLLVASPTISSDRLASNKDRALTLRSSYSRTFFRWKVRQCLLRANRGGDWGAYEHAYDHLVVAIPEYTMPGRLTRGFLSRVGTSILADAGV
ncbi:hypothetical protein FN846DRAFT_908748 [Sphaerosporella brunnea]|uniref:Uncharacterized protein n=1 Tax=Sphaerosporella brunnea TaxID=1250544 RepID=A0A5J5ETU8_9PEZI|nr:hypothetical protein FN846DRAFT_908748 [Sphaerosporella brunnea]